MSEYPSNYNPPWWAFLPYETQRNRAEYLEDRESELWAALSEAAMLLETAALDGHVTLGWYEDANTWRTCWADLIEGK